MQVAIWDPRASSARPQTILVAPQNMPQLTQVQASYDGHVITAGARTGQVGSGHMRSPCTGQTYNNPRSLVLRESLVNSARTRPCAQYDYMTRSVMVTLST